MLISHIEKQQEAVIAIKEGNVSFNQVTFGYDPEQAVLHEIDFQVSAGETVALVGHTGSGNPVS